MLIKISPIFLFLICSCAKNAETPKVQPVAVTTYVVEPQDIAIDYSFTGIAESSHLVQIWSRVEGYLDKIAYTEGGFVHEGDVLYQIDPRQFQAAVNAAKGDLEKEKASLTSAKQSVERFKPLFVQKAASRKDLDDANSQLLAEEAAVSVFEAKLQEAELNLSYATIRSPISGLTTNSRSQEGTLINPSTNGLLTTVSVVDPIWVIINISDYFFLKAEEDVAKGVLKLPPNFDFDIVVTLADGTEFPEHGKMSFVSPVFDPNTGSLSARAVFANPNSLLKPGQFVRVKALGATRLNSIIIPQQAVQQGSKSMMVYVVNGGKVEMRPVEVGDLYGKSWIIKSGLEEGDEVVVEGVNKISNGSTVAVVNRQKARSKRTLK